MSGITKEWNLKTGENSIKYTVVVPNFRKKINTFKAGRSIRSKDFKVGRSVFYLAINPNGKEKNSSGVYLHNKSDWDVIADVKFEVKDRKRVLKEERFVGDGSGTGFSDMAPHHRCTNRDLLIDGQFQLVTYIELKDEEVLPNHDVEDEVISKIMSHVDKKFESVDRKFESVDKKLESMESKFSEVEAKLKVISSLLLGGASSSSSRELECPVCSETVRRPMRLYQCGQV